LAIGNWQLAIGNRQSAMDFPILDVSGVSVASFAAARSRPFQRGA
jgi:hypothetical protein